MVSVMVEDHYETKKHLLTCTACVITDTCLVYDALIIKEELNKDVKAIVPEVDGYDLSDLQLKDTRLFQEQSK